jgi:hypothetical protein
LKIRFEHGKYPTRNISWEREYDAECDIMGTYNDSGLALNEMDGAGPMTRRPDLIKKDIDLINEI